MVIGCTVISFNNKGIYDVNKPNSYDEVMKELEEVSDLLSCDKTVDNDSDEVHNSDFKWEYAHESLTERHSAYKKRISHV